MEPTDILLAIGSAIGGGGISQLLTWRITRKKAKEDVKTSEIDNMSKAMEFYRTLTDEQTRHIDALNKRISEQDEKIAVQQKELDTLHDQIISLYKIIGREATGIAGMRKVKMHKPRQSPKMEAST